MEKSKDIKRGWEIRRAEMEAEIADGKRTKNSLDKLRKDYDNVVEKLEGERSRAGNRVWMSL